MTKTKKLIISASVIWGLISIIISGALAEESFGGFNIWAFLGIVLFFTFPIWLYWTISWIFGEGFLFKNISKIKPLLLQWPDALSIGWFLLCMIIAVGELISGSSSFWEALLIPVVIGAPSWIYWIFKYQTRHKRQTLEYKIQADSLKISHPWKRFWARWLDWFVCGLFVFTPIFWGIDTIAFSGTNDLLGISEQFKKMESWYQLTNNPAFVAMVVVLMWIPIEGVLLHFTGTTPGKFLFGIKIIGQDGKKLGLQEAFQRSLRVAMSGAAFGFPLLNFVFFYCAYQQLKERKKTVWDEAGNYSVAFDKLPILRQGLAFLCIASALCASAYLRTIPVDDYSKYEQDTTSYGVLQKNMEDRANKLWVSFNADLNLARALSRDLEGVKNLTQYSLRSNIEDRRVFAEKFSNYKRSLTSNLDLFRAEVATSNIQPNFKKEILKGFGSSAEKTKKMIGDYVSAVEQENKAYLDVSLFVEKNFIDIQIENNRLLFSTPQQFERYGELLKVAKDAEAASLEAQGRLTEYVIGDNPRRSDIQKADLSDAYFEIRVAFESSPAYGVLSTLYDGDKASLERLYRGYVETYAKSGFERAEQEIVREMRDLVDARLTESLPKASNTALFSFTQSIVSLTDQMYEKRPDLCPGYFNGAVEDKEFSTFFVNEMSGPLREKHLSSITEVVLSAKNRPGAYTLSTEEIEQKLELPYLKAFAAVGKKAGYLMDGSVPENPGDVCVTVGAIYREVLQLSSPDREDILRYMYSLE